MDYTTDMKLEIISNIHVFLKKPCMSPKNYQNGNIYLWINWPVFEVDLFNMTIMLGVQTKIRSNNFSSSVQMYCHQCIVIDMSVPLNGKSFLLKFLKLLSLEPLNGYC